VDDYFKELETTLTKVDMHESEESKMARFVSGLRKITHFYKNWFTLPSR